jgi:hypothetical protein
MDQRQSDLILDRQAFSVVDLDSQSDEPGYWLTKTPQERLTHLERLRRINYVPSATERLQRIFEVVDLTPG